MYLARKKKKRYPSQERYDLSHPVLSIRFSRMDLLRIKELAEMNETKLSVMVKEALLEHVGNMDKLYQEAFSEGYDDGLIQAKKKYKIRYPCCRCGELTSILPNSDEHKDIIIYMKKQGWHHGEC